MMQQIQLNAQEGIEYAGFTSYCDGYAQGVAATLEHFKRKRLGEILAARKPAPPQGMQNNQEETSDRG